MMFITRVRLYASRLQHLQPEASADSVSDTMKTPLAL